MNVRYLANDRELSATVHSTLIAVAVLVLAVVLSSGVVGCSPSGQGDSPSGQGETAMSGTVTDGDCSWVGTESERVTGDLRTNDAFLQARIVRETD